MPLTKAEINKRYYENKKNKKKSKNENLNSENETLNEIEVINDEPTQDIPKTTQDIPKTSQETTQDIPKTTSEEDNEDAYSDVTFIEHDENEIIQITATDLDAIIKAKLEEQRKLFFLTPKTDIKKEPETETKGSSIPSWAWGAIGTVGLSAVKTILPVAIEYFTKTKITTAPRPESNAQFFQPGPKYSTQASTSMPFVDKSVFGS